MSAPHYEKARQSFLSGIEAFDRRDYLAAEQLYRDSLRWLPGRPSVMTNLASVLLMLGRLQEAQAYAMEVLALESNNIEAMLNLGVVQERLGQPKSAIDWYDAVLQVSPEHCAAMTNKASVLDDLGQFGPALKCLEQSIAINPEDYYAWNTLGSVYAHLKQTDKACVAYERAVQLDKHAFEAKYNLGILFLQHQDFERGWQLYENRWNRQNNDSVYVISDRPAWRGDVLNGKLLVWAEQGIGDVTFFLGMLDDLRRRVSSVIVAVPKRMLDLLGRSFPGVQFVDVESVHGEAEFDVQIAMGSLGQYLRKNAADMHGVRTPYLVTDGDLANLLRLKLRKDRQKVCGLSWVSKNTQMGFHKTMLLKQLMPVLELQGYTFVDLQYGDTDAERASLVRETGIEVKRLPDIDTFNDLDGLAALIDACDLVVTVSNTTAHFAGALGKKTLLMLPYSVGKIWYWHENQDRSIWYPSVQIFRQQTMGDWSAPIEAIRQEMLKLTKAD